MSEEEQRIAIAEYCGWNKTPITNPHPDSWAVNCNKPDWFYLHQLPNYLHDLNAQIAAWRQLSNDDKIVFAQWLIKLGCINPDYKCDIAITLAIQLFDQHFPEAFLRTINKWKQP